MWALLSKHAADCTSPPSPRDGSAVGCPRSPLGDLLISTHAQARGTHFCESGTHFTHCPLSQQYPTVTPKPRPEIWTELPRGGSRAGISKAPAGHLTAKMALRTTR